MKYVFGPVPSRRLGQSLGIDTIPLKTCNWNCVYCQLGRSVPLTNERQEYFPREEILSEVEGALAAHRPGEIDWVTFVGSGEPTLYLGIGWLIQEVKKLTELPIAVITNGALFYLPEIRQELVLAEAILPTLDAGNARLYRRINRPHPHTTFKRLVEGLIAFRAEYTGKLWLEVMLVRGLNDTEEALREIATVMKRIQPDEVHINLPTRPPAEPWVQSPDEEGLMRAMVIFGKIARVVYPAEGNFDLSGYDNVVDAIISIITRHPMGEEDLRHALENWSPGQVDSALEKLSSSGKAQVLERYGMRFWSAASSYYPEESQRQTVTPGSNK